MQLLEFPDGGRKLLLLVIGEGEGATDIGVVPLGSGRCFEDLNSVIQAALFGERSGQIRSDFHKTGLAVEQLTVVVDGRR